MAKKQVAIFAIFVVYDSLYIGLLESLKQDNETSNCFLRLNHAFFKT